MEAKRQVPKRAWCFTEFEVKTYEEVLRGEDFLKKWNVQFLSIQNEICPSTKVHHIQGFVYFQNARILSGVKLVLPKAHWEQALDKAPYATAIEYTTVDKKHKDGTPDTSWIPGTQFQWGDKPQAQGARSDVTELREAIKTGTVSYTDAIGNYNAGLRYARGVQDLVREHYKPPPYKIPKELKATCVYGDAGLGKTMFLKKRAAAEGKSLCILKNRQLRNGWYDGYNNHDWVLFDDIDGSTFKYPRDLMGALDGDDGRVPVKGGFVKWAPEMIFITCDKHPYDFYPQWITAKPNHYAQFKRRFQEVKLMTDDETFEDKIDYEPEPPMTWRP